MQPPDKPDARRSSRVRVGIRAEVGIAGVLYRCEVTNLSLGGVAVATKEMLRPGAICHVTLLLEGGEETLTCDLEGTVVRSSATEAGISFTEVVGIEGLDHLHKLLLYNASEPDRIVGEFEHFIGLRHRG